MRIPAITRYFGVDFSGARLAGRNTWIAECKASGGRKPPVELVSLDCLETLAGTADREPALKHLVGLVRKSTAAVWGMDFPFGLPIELFPGAFRWTQQFGFLAGFGEDAYECGLECVRRTRAANGRLHVRRHTDTDAKTPYDCSTIKTKYLQDSDFDRLRRDLRAEVLCTALVAGELETEGCGWCDGRSLFIDGDRLDNLPSSGFSTR